MKESKYVSTNPPAQENNLLADMVKLKSIVARVEKIWRETDELEFFNAQHRFPKDVWFSEAMEHCLMNDTAIENAIDDFSRFIDKAIGEL